MATDGNVDLGDLNPAEETPFRLEGSLEPALSLPLFALQGAGHSGSSLTAYAPGLTLPAFSVTQAATADGAVLPAFTLSGQAASGTYVTGRLGVPAFSLSGSLEPPLVLPMPEVAASGTIGTALVAPLLQLPRLQLAATSADHAAMSLAPFALAGSVLAGGIGRASIALPSWAVGSAGSQDAVGEGAITFGLLQVNAGGGADALVEGMVTLSPVTLEAFAGTGQVSNAQLTVPLFEVTASGFMEAIGSATMQVPAFEIAGQGASVGAVPVLVPRPVTTAIVLNTRLKGVVRYQGMRANSFAAFAGLQLAATPDGIVALMGETDLGMPISASVTSGTSDLGATERKRIEAAYVGYRSGGDMEMTLVTDEHHEYSYRLVARQIPDALHPTRVKFGKGVDGRYWQWTLANTNGGGFDLASLQLNVIPLSRSV